MHVVVFVDVGAEKGGDALLLAGRAGRGILSLFGKRRIQKERQMDFLAPPRPLRNLGARPPTSWVNAPSLGKMLSKEELVGERVYFLTRAGGVTQGEFVRTMEALARKGPHGILATCYVAFLILRPLPVDLVTLPHWRAICERLADARETIRAERSS